MIILCDLEKVKELLLSAQYVERAKIFAKKAFTMMNNKMNTKKYVSLIAMY